VALGASKLRATLAADLLADLDELDRPALLYRLGNLTNELRERAKWEALRSHDAWRRAEVESHAKHDRAVQAAKHDITRKHEQQVRARAPACACNCFACHQLASSPHFLSLTRVALLQLSLVRAAGEVRLAEAVGAAELDIARTDAAALEAEASKVQAILDAEHAASEVTTRRALLASPSNARTPPSPPMICFPRCFPQSALAEAAAVTRGKAQTDAAAAAATAAVERREAAEALARQAEALGMELAAGKELTATGAAHQRSSAAALAGALPGAHPSLASLQRSFEDASAAGLKAALVPKGLEGTGIGRFLGRCEGPWRAATPVCSTAPCASHRMWCACRGAACWRQCTLGLRPRGPPRRCLPRPNRH